LDFCGGAPCELPRGVARDAFTLNVTARNYASVAKVWDNSEGSRHEWPLVSLSNFSRTEDLVEPLAVDLSCFHSPSDSCSIEDVRDGENINQEYVSKWVPSKLQSIAGCIGVAFSGYEQEVIQLLSRIEKCNAPSKSSVQRTSPSSRRHRELCRLEFGVNYDRPNASFSGMKVLNGFCLGL